MTARILTQESVFADTGHRGQVVHELPFARFPQFAASAVQGAVAGQYGYIQLFNPASSGKELVVFTIEFDNPIASLVNSRMGYTTTVFGTALLPVVTTHGGTALASPVGQLRSSTNASDTAFGMTPSTGAFKKTIGVNTGIHVEQLLLPHEALTIPEGVGLLIMMLFLNTEMTVNLRWVEVDT